MRSSSRDTSTLNSTLLLVDQTPAGGSYLKTPTQTAPNPMYRPRNVKYRTTLKIVASAEFSNGPAASGSRSPSFVVLTSLAVKSGTNNTRRVFARIEYVTAWGSTRKSSTGCKQRTQVNNYVPSLSLLGKKRGRRFADRI